MICQGLGCKNTFPDTGKRKFCATCKQKRNLTSRIRHIEEYGAVDTWERRLQKSLLKRKLEEEIKTPRNKLNLVKKDWSPTVIKEGDYETLKGDDFVVVCDKYNEKLKEIWGA
jgi:hypothetical protein